MAIAATDILKQQEHVSEEDLRYEFHNDFYGVAPYEADITFLSLLIRESVLKVKKCKIPGEYPSDFLKGNFLKHFAWTIHFRNYSPLSDAVLNKMVCDYRLFLNSGKYIIIHEPWYCGYRADIGIVPANRNPDGSDNNKIILAVEIGETQINKIIECTTRLPNLKAIWHAVDWDKCFIWSKGENSNRLEEVIGKHFNYLDKLYQQKKKIVRDRLARGEYWLL